MLPSVVI